MMSQPSRSYPGRALARSSKVRYAIHFPEANNPGYFLVNMLAAGAYGLVLLVLAASGKLCVKKIEENPSVPKPDGSHCPEVSFYVAHDNIPQLISHLEYNFPLNTPHMVKNTTTWQFCNGGTLDAMTLRIRTMRPHNRTRSGLPTPPVRMPETFIWNFFLSMLSLLVELHLQGLAHNDLHAANIFFHWPSFDSVFPISYLGDFGLAKRYPKFNHRQRARLTRPWQIDDLTELDQLDLTQSSRLNQESLWQQCSDWYIASFKDHHNLGTHLFQILTAGTPAGAKRRTADLQRAALGRVGLDGYSASLVRIIHSYCQLWASAGPDSSPADLMKQTQDILESVRQTTLTRVRVSERRLARISQQQAQGSSTSIRGQCYEADQDVHNILQELRPQIPEATPFLWLSPNDVGSDEIDQFRVDLVQDECLLDSGTYEIVAVKEVRRAGKKQWIIVGKDDNPDDIETDDEGDHPRQEDHPRPNTTPFQLYNKPAENLTNEEIRDILASVFDSRLQRPERRNPPPPATGPAPVSESSQDDPIDPIVHPAPGSDSSQDDPIDPVTHPAPVPLSISSSSQVSIHPEPIDLTIPSSPSEHSPPPPTDVPGSGPTIIDLTHSSSSSEPHPAPAPAPASSRLLKREASPDSSSLLSRLRNLKRSRTRALTRREVTPRRPTSLFLPSNPRPDHDNESHAHRHQRQQRPRTSDGSGNAEVSPDQNPRTRKRRRTGLEEVDDLISRIERWFL